MATYRVTKDVGAGAGYLYNNIGAMIPINSLAPKVGDIVNGVIEEHTIGNITQRGINVELSTGAGQGDNKTTVFIPESSLELTNGATPPAATKKSLFSAGNIALLALIAIATILIFKKNK